MKISETVKLPSQDRNIPSLFKDRVLIIVSLALAFMFVLDPAQAFRSLQFVLKAMVHIAPFFLLAVFFTGFAKASGADQRIARVFSGRTAATIVAASLAGALSPFCSCGVIPLVAAMLVSGVPLAPVMAFCISSPVMDPEMFLLTTAGISLNFAAAKTLAAIGMGIMAGSSVHMLQRMGFLSDPLKQSLGCSCGQPSFDPHANVNVAWRFWDQPVRRGQFIEETKKNGLFLGKWMAFAFFLESLMIAYVPQSWIAGFAGQDSLMAIPLSAIIGVPAYLNGYAAIPLVSGLMKMGMAPGAAMAFITAGAVSSIPAALAVYALVKKPVFFLYIAIGFSGSVIAGFIYEWLV